MKTWRERIAEARERGGFTPEDWALALDASTCAVGEVTHDRHNWFIDALLEDERTSLPMLWYPLSGRFTNAVRHNKVDLAEETLDAIEDRYRCLKREGLVPTA